MFNNWRNPYHVNVFSWAGGRVILETKRLRILYEDFVGSSLDLFTSIPAGNLQRHSYTYCFKPILDKGLINYSNLLDQHQSL